MKKIFILISLITLTLSLSACSSSNQDQIQKTTPTTSSEVSLASQESSDSDMTLTYNGFKISLKQNMKDVINSIGQPVNYTSSKSCNYVGEDKVYEYDGFTIYTYPDNEDDYILEIELNGDNVSTNKNAKVGMTLDEFTKIYGDDYTIDGINYNYPASNQRYLYCTVEGDVIQTIAFATEE